MIDLHCHLDLYPDPSKIVEECQRRGLYVLSVTTTPSAWEITNRFSSSDNRIRTAIGLHPQIAHERKSELPLFDSILPRTRYVGEVGLDGSPEFRSFWNDQIVVFDHILNACERAGGRILSIHSRRAATAVLDRLEAHLSAGTPVLHWFSGNMKELDRAIALGCWFSVGPAMLASANGRRLVSHMPRDRVLTESDGPFAQLAGNPVVPWDIKQAIDQLSLIWAATTSEVEKILVTNLRRLLLADPDSSLAKEDGR